MRTVFLTKRWQHHTPSGGYDMLAAKYPGASAIRRAPVVSAVAKVGRRIWEKFPSGEALLDYQFGDFLAENRALLLCARGKVDVVHALYGDEQADLLLRRRRWLRSHLVATFHLPSEQVAGRWQRRPSEFNRGIDAAVVVARSQLDDYRRWFGEERVVYIPHGIDTERFVPSGPRVPEERLRLLTVGDHMRDWETLHRVADYCATRKLPVEIDAVVKSSSAAHFTGCDNVRLHISVSESALVDLYQRADALLLPVTAATANNAVLESLACGTPVLTSDTGGMPDYVDETCGWLFPSREWQPMAAQVEAMCGDRTLAEGKRPGARARAQAFDWQTVVLQTQAVHAAVVGGLPASQGLPARAANE